MKPYGLSIRSILPLPGCAGSDETPDVTIQFGYVSDTLPGATLIKACTQECKGQFLLTLDRVANYLVENGNSITIQPAPGATEDEIRLFLMGSVWSVLLLQRGLLPLHGCGIMTDNGAVVFTGPSGNGKSTLAAAFMDRGFPLIADELCAIRITDQPMLLQGFPQVLLWEDALKKLGKDIKGLSPARPDLLKYIVPVNNTTHHASIPLKRIYILSTDKDNMSITPPLKGMKKIQALIDSTYHAHHVEGQGVRVDHFKQCSSAASHIEVKGVERPSGPFDIEKLVKLITEDFQRGQL